MGGIATGRYHASHMSNQQTWEEAVSYAGRSSGDLSFPAVFCPELQFPEFTSAVADMKNSVADRNNAQPSCAGLFIFANLGFEFPGVWRESYWIRGGAAQHLVWRLQQGGDAPVSQP